MIGMNDNASTNGLNERQMMVYNPIRASTLEQGISKEDIYAQLQGRISKVEFEYVLILFILFLSFILDSIYRLVGRESLVLRWNCWVGDTQYLMLPKWENYNEKVHIYFSNGDHSHSNHVYSLFIRQSLCHISTMASINGLILIIY